MFRIGRRTPQYGMQRRSGKGRLWVGLAIAAFALISYFGSAEHNPITGEKQYLAFSPSQEIAMGLQAAPHMARQHGGLHPNQQAQRQVDHVGMALVKGSVARDTQWQFEFHLLADEQTVNAFALPGGQIFITAALYDKLTNENELAGVLAHEIGHVVARHGAQKVAKHKLTQGLTSAAVVASGEYSAGQMTQMVGKLVNMRYGREDELESDALGVRFMIEAGYDPEALIAVMKILKAASGGGRQPEFFSTHPNPENRIEKIREAIARYKNAPSQTM